MGSVTYVVVTDPYWEFGRDHLYDALTAAHAHQHPRRENDPPRLRAEGFRDAWTVEVADGRDHVIIGAPALTMVRLVAWVRAYVPADVGLEVFDSDLTFDPRPLPPGVTVEELVSDYWPDVPELEISGPAYPPTLEERARAGKPPHLP